MKPLLVNEELIKRKQIIQHAFADELSPQQIEKAIVLWDNLFRYSATFASKTFQFTNILCVELNLHPSNRLRLMTKLLRSFNLLKDSTIVEPPPLEVQHKTMSDNSIIFNAMLSEIVDYLKQEHPENIPLLKQYLLEEIPLLEFEPKALQALLTWCKLMDSNSLIIDEGLSKQKMTAFIDLLYEELCGLFGAKQTDLLFSIVITNCEKRPEAKRFSPHDLL